jgi:ATP-binding cassette subfamily F protein 3
MYLDGPISKLSGGWQTRVKLAALLLHDPNLLLLDEPTNFLDLRTQILLEHFLQEYRAACLIVSHDRAFLGATCSHTLDLARGKLSSFPGKVDAYLQYLEEKSEHDERSNAAIMAKRRHLEDFIARNKARASTAKLAQSKSKQLEKLELNDIASDLPTARIRAPRVEPRKGPALRCKDLAIGYPEREIASGIGMELDHGSRAAIVGDNGQGKTTFLRTLVDSLKPVAGEVRWGFGCKIGVYAQHVYTSLPDGQTVLGYLQLQASRGKKDQEILDIAGSFLFRGPNVRKPVSVLSGGERARLCMAGLLLSECNILILDEPGNHLDVDTVEALAEALLEYEGTLIFTSHDRHFTKRVATCIVEVRDGRVVNHSGSYDSYLDKVNSEIEAGERERATDKAKAPPRAATAAASPVIAERVETDPRKIMKTLERTIAQLDGRKKEINILLDKTKDADIHINLQMELEDLAVKLNEAEERWGELYAEVEGYA